MKWSLLLSRHYAYYDQYPLKNGKPRPRKKELYCGEFETKQKELQSVGNEIFRGWLISKNRKPASVSAFTIDEKACMVTVAIGGQFGWPKK